MDRCDGYKDWLLCLKCQLICTSLCPLESDDVIFTLSEQLKKAEQTVKNQL